MITWNESYLIGNKIIDDQHKMLFKICDKITDLHKNKLVTDKYEEIMGLITELREYASFHFYEEEAYMRKINYAGYEEQRIEHEKFLEKLLDVNLKEIDNNQDKYIENLLVFVLAWICDHIVTKDKFIK